MLKRAVIIFFILSYSCLFGNGVIEINSLSAGQMSARLNKENLNNKDQTPRHPERSEGSPALWRRASSWRSLAPLRMTDEQLHQRTKEMPAAHLRSPAMLQSHEIIAAKRISLNFQDIQVRAVLQLLAELTGINVVVSDKVSGNITLRLNNIPWDEALDIILTTKSLIKRKMGDVILVMPAGDLMHQKGNVVVQRGLVSKAPLQSELLQINYAKAADVAVLLKDKNTTFLSPRGKLSVDNRTNVIWIEDTGEQVKQIKAFIHQLDRPVKQVLIEARIVNVTKDFAQELGVHFEMSRPAQASNSLEETARAIKNTKPVDVISLADRLNLDLATTTVSATGGSIGLALAKLGSGILLDLELSALESEGRGEILSNPRLITTNQQPALIESGEEVPYQETTTNGATAVAFKKAVLSLKVTPQITPDSKILMDLQISQDTLSPKVFNGVPAILTKEIQTNVLVDNGQTLVLGGIYKQNKNNMVNRIPFLGTLPVVGSLFRSQSEAIKNEELLIFITPRIITNNSSALVKEVSN